MTEICLHPSKETFQINEDETILEAAFRQNITLPHSCKKGSCSSCLVTVLVDGIESGMIKTCAVKPNQDMVLSVNPMPELENIFVKMLPCRIKSLDYASDNVIILKLRTPPNQSLKFLSGQYIDLLKAGIRRSYSMASSPQENIIELHIRRVAQGKFSEYLFLQAKKNDLLRLEGPFGTFFRRDKDVFNDKSIVFVAGGTGFAPVASMIKSMLNSSESRPVSIYWGNKDETGFYTNMPEEWSKQYSWINYIPVHSSCSNTKSPKWLGRTGLVHKAVLEDFLTLDSVEIFVCGSMSMVEAARADFIQAGLDPNSFFADTFLPTS